MENISYHLAAGSIDKELLQDIVRSFLDDDIDFSEELKFRILIAIGNNEIDLED
jgi:death-on-curing protein